MSSLPLHPAIVHLPLGIAVALPFIALGLLAALWRGALPRRAWAVILGLQILLQATGFMALRTGEGEEDRVEDRLSHAAIHEHEERAEAFMVGAGIVLALSVGVLLIRREKVTRWLAVATTAGTLVVAGLAISTGEAGGQLVFGDQGSLTNR
jgi:hypothetical protein